MHIIHIQNDTNIKHISFCTSELFQNANTYLLFTTVLYFIL